MPDTYEISSPEQDYSSLLQKQSAEESEIPERTTWPTDNKLTFTDEYQLFMCSQAGFVGSFLGAKTIRFPCTIKLVMTASPATHQSGFVVPW